MLVAGRGWMDHVPADEPTISCEPNAQAGYTLMSAAPVFVQDLRHEKRFVPQPIHLQHGVVSSVSVAISDGEKPVGVLGAYALHRRTFTADDGDFLLSIAGLIEGAIQNDRARQQVQLHLSLQEQHLRHEVALSTCAQSLLAATGADRLERAAEALLSATRATHIFVKRNVADPDLGISSTKVVEIEREEPFVSLTEEPEDTEQHLYATDACPVGSELDVPIFVEGERTGLIGFADTTAVREWTEDDLSLLTTAATMIGAFWEREIARERREQTIRTKDSFMASVSHELRTPLSAVLGFGQILQDDGGSLSMAERSELVETVVRQATDLTNIVNDLLVAAKTDTGTLQVAKVPVTLRAQTAQALEAFEHEQASHIVLTGEATRAMGDPHRVRQIVRNLVSNALRYGGGTIRVEMSADADTARVLVCDDGSPIPARDRDRIFEQYQRAHDVPELADSLGLGLAISRQLARRMDGDLTYRHEGGESIFELALPRAD